MVFSSDFARCYDANLVEIPVEIESPDHHYYHVRYEPPDFNFCSFIFKMALILYSCAAGIEYFATSCYTQLAFFTTRKIEAFEELTWVSYIILDPYSP